MQPIDDKSFKKCINLCKKKINESFKIYSDITNSNFSWETFISFQNNLIETLYEEKKQEIPLRKTLKKIRNGSDTINTEKDVLRKIEQLETLEHSIKILGDFFCYIFYMNDFDLIDKHIEKPQVGMHSIGSGIVAEMETIKRLNVPENPQFYLYNELSSFLRIGDVSVFDRLQSRIIGFGEIKSSIPQDGKLDISIDFIVKSQNLYVPTSLQHKENKGHDFLDEDMIKHLEKQVDTMKDSLVNKKQVDKNLQQEVKLPHYKDLELLINQCYRNGFAIKKVSNDIMYLSVKNDFNDLNIQNIDLNEKFKSNNIIEDFNLNPKDGYNNIIYSKLELLSYGKNTPFLFLPLSNNAKKKALNQSLFIIFNYNTIIKHFSEQGFVFVKKKKIPYLEKKLENEIISLCLYAIHEQYVNMFLDEKSAIDILTMMLSESKVGKGNRQIFVNMKYINKK